MKALHLKKATCIGMHPQMVKSEADLIVGGFQVRPQGHVGGKVGIQIEGNCCFWRMEVVWGGRGSGIGKWECGLAILVSAIIIH